MLTRWPWLDYKHNNYIASLKMESFDNIYLDLSKESGKCRFAETGFGWKSSGGGEAFTLDHSNIGAAQWSKAAKGFEVKILLRNSGLVQLDGFSQEDYDRLSKIFKNWYSTNLQHKEHSLCGWNWGKGEFGKSELAFNVQNRPAFEIPYSEISNTNLAGRNEVAIEFMLPTSNNESNANNSSENARMKSKKAGAGTDQLVEMRFYIPGHTTKKVVTDSEDVPSAGEGGEEQSAANLFYDTLMEKAEIGEVAGDTFATFLDVLHLTPRGRFDIDMYENSFRLRGKTYDYKIQYEHLKKFMILPKPDELHYMICIGLDPPLRQGQTRYPFLVMQFKKDEEVTIDLNMTEEMMKDKYNGRLSSHYEQPIHQVVTQVFRGLTGKKVNQPAQGFTSHHGQYGIKCSIKASEGFLYCLEKAFIFVPKPATFIQFDYINRIVLSRVGGAISASRTFDITIQMKEGTESQFSNINREEQKPLEEFFKMKGLKTKNEMDDDSSALLAAALREPEMASSDDEVVTTRVERGSEDDDESIDEDFQTDSESDVAEEYDSAHESEGSGSEAEAPEAEKERPKKKSKTS